MKAKCFYCGKELGPVDAYLGWWGADGKSLMPDGSAGIRFCSAGTPHCQDKFIAEAMFKTLADFRGEAEKKSSKPEAMTAVLASIEKHPQLADRILALAEKALS